MIAFAKFGRGQGKPMKKPEPLPPKKPEPRPPKRAPAPAAKVAPQADDDIDRALRGEDGGRHPREVDGYVEGGEVPDETIPVGDFGTAQTFGGKGGGAARGAGASSEDTGKAVVAAGGASKEVLQTPVNNGGRTDAYVWSQVDCVDCLLAVLPLACPRALAPPLLSPEA